MQMATMPTIISQPERTHHRDVSDLPEREREHGVEGRRRADPRQPRIPGAGRETLLDPQSASGSRSRCQHDREEQQRERDAGVAGTERPPPAMPPRVSIPPPRQVNIPPFGFVDVLQRDRRTRGDRRRVRELRSLVARDHRAGGSCPPARSTCCRQPGDHQGGSCRGRTGGAPYRTWSLLSSRRNFTTRVGEHLLVGRHRESRPAVAAVSALRAWGTGGVPGLLRDLARVQQRLGLHRVERRRHSGGVTRSDEKPRARHRRSPRTPLDPRSPR